MRSAVISRLIVDADYQGYDENTFGLANDAMSELHDETDIEFDIVQDCPSILLHRRRPKKAKRPKFYNSPPPVWVRPSHSAPQQPKRRRPRANSERCPVKPQIPVRTAADDLQEAGFCFIQFLSRGKVRYGWTFIGQEASEVT